MQSRARGRVMERKTANAARVVNITARDGVRFTFILPRIEGPAQEPKQKTNADHEPTSTKKIRMTKWARAAISAAERGNSGPIHFNPVKPGEDILGLIGKLGPDINLFCAKLGIDRSNIHNVLYNKHKIRPPLAKKILDFAKSNGVDIALALPASWNWVKRLWYVTGLELGEFAKEARISKNRLSALGLGRENLNPKEFERLVQIARRFGFEGYPKEFPEPEIVMKEIDLGLALDLEISRADVFSGSNAQRNALGRYLAFGERILSHD